MSAFVDGVRDILPEEIRERKWIYQSLREVFARDGYQEVVTPTLESLDLYGGVETLFPRERMFKVVDEKGQILVLRPDLTLPITRLAATRFASTPRPWKFSYINTAYRNNSGQSHQMKEKTQAGIELLGRDDLLAEVEVIGILIQSLQKLGLEKPMIDIGQAALVKEVFNYLNLEKKRELKLRQLMEEKNMTEISANLASWGLEGKKQDLITSFPALFGQPGNVLQGLKQLPLNEKAVNIIEELEEIYLKFEAIGLGEYITFDPTMVTSLGYYTGPIFKAYVKGYGGVVASGGRYDGLAGKFGLDVPAVGFAIEIESLIECLRKFRIKEGARSKGLVLFLEKRGEFPELYRLAALLRKSGLRVELYSGETLVEYCRFHQFNYTGRWKNGNLILKNHQDKKTIRLSGTLNEIAAQCRCYIKRGNSGA